MSAHALGLDTTEGPPKMTGLCECGCGELAPIARQTRTDKGQIKGQPLRFVASHNRRGAKDPRPAEERVRPGTYFRSCDTCGTSFKVRPSEVRKAEARGHQHPRFCSPPCQHATYIGTGNPKWRGGTYLDSDGYVYELAPDHPHASSAGYVRQHRLVAERELGRYLDPDEVVHHRNRVKDDNRPENLEVLPDGSTHQIEHGDWRPHNCVECGTQVLRSAGMRRRGVRVCCSVRCGAARGSRAAAAKASA